MSLADIKGTALGTKMGVKPSSAIIATAIKTGTQIVNKPTSTLKPTVIPSVIATAKATLAPVSPLTSNIKTVVNVPATFSGSVVETAKQGVSAVNTVSTFIDALGLATKVIAARTFNPLNQPTIQQQVLKSTSQLPTQTAATPTSVLTSPYGAAIQQASVQKLGGWNLQNPAVQKVMAVARTGATFSAFNKAYPGNVDFWNEVLNKAIYPKEKQDVQRIAEWKQREAQTITAPLVVGTAEGWKAQQNLVNTEKWYTYVTERYTELINQGGGGGQPTAPEGTNWGNIAIIGILVIGAVMLLSSFIKRGK